MGREDKSSGSTLLPLNRVRIKRQACLDMMMEAVGVAVLAGRPGVWFLGDGHLRDVMVFQGSLEPLDGLLSIHFTGKRLAAQVI